MNDVERHREALERVLSSRLFSEAPVQSKLLRFLAEKTFAGTADDLKEYSIGIELFSKRDSYSPQSDPSVRVQSSRLRNRLEEYFRTEGSDSGITIRLPKGSFGLLFEARAQPGAEQPADARPEARSHGRRRLALAAGLAMVAVVAVYEAAVIRTLRNELRQTGPDASVARLWAPLLASPRPLKLVVGMPVWMRLEGGYYRHISVNSPADIRASAAVERLFRLTGQKPDRLEYGFNGFGETVEAFLLGRLFFSARKPVTLTRSNTLSWEELRSQDVVLLGSSKSNPHLRDMPLLVNYRLLRGGIQVLRPSKGEPDWYRPTLNEREETVSDYAIVARVPGVGGHGYITVLGAESTGGNWAAAEAMTDPRQAQSLISRLADRDGRVPEFFELILRAEFQSTVPVKIGYVRHRIVSQRQAVR